MLNNRQKGNHVIQRHEREFVAAAPPVEIINPSESKTSDTSTELIAPLVAR